MKKILYIISAACLIIGTLMAAQPPATTLPLGSVMFDPVTKQIVRPSNFWQANKEEIKIQLGGLGGGTPLTLVTGPGIYATITNDLDNNAILWIGFIGAAGYTNIVVPPPSVDTNYPSGTFYVDHNGYILMDEQGRWLMP